MKNAIKFGFGFAFGTWLFHFSKKLATAYSDGAFKRRFSRDDTFREFVRIVAPDLYETLMKECAKGS